jgi:hypothetical protein
MMGGNVIRADDKLVQALSKTGRFWVYLRDERAWMPCGGSTPGADRHHEAQTLVQPAPWVTDAGLEWL